MHARLPVPGKQQMAEMTEATKAEREALAWLVEHVGGRAGRGAEFYSSVLRGLYEDRWRQQDGERRQDAPIGKRRSWRRTSGTVLRRLERKGFVAAVHVTEHATRYALTDAGREATHA